MLEVHHVIVATLCGLSPIGSSPFVRVVCFPEVFQVYKFTFILHGHLLFVRHSK